MSIAIYLQAINLHRKMLKETLEFPNIKMIKSRLVDLFRHLRLGRLISMCLFSDAVIKFCSHLTEMI